MDSFTEDIRNIVKVFKGSCKGVVLSKRGNNDNHIIITIITEDDENWFISNRGFSNYWLHDLEIQLKLATNWLLENCILDRVDNKSYGYKLIGS